MIIHELTKFGNICNVDLEFDVKGQKIIIPAILHEDSKELFINKSSIYHTYHLLWNIDILSEIGKANLKVKE